MCPRSEPGHPRRNTIVRRTGSLGRRACTIGAAGVLVALTAIGVPGRPAAKSHGFTAANPSSEAVVLDASRAPGEGDWVVLKAAGEVVWRPSGGVVWQPIARGQVLAALSEIETGPNGEVILVVGGDRLVLASSSRLVLPARGPGQDQRLRVERGRMRFDVERRAGRDVEVRTPLLSLGIKGTSIEVAVDGEQNSVLVLEGRVAVSTGAGAPEDLGPGEGLRQRAEPGAEATPLSVADPLATFDRGGAVRWYLPAPAKSSPGPEATAPLAVERDPLVLRERTAQRPAPLRASDQLGGWLDHKTSLVAVLLIAVGGLVILIAPGLVLGRNLRQQWQDRPTHKGRRRRSLIHG